MKLHDEEAERFRNKRRVKSYSAEVFGLRGATMRGGAQVNDKERDFRPSRSTEESQNISLNKTQQTEQWPETAVFTDIQK